MPNFLFVCVKHRVEVRTRPYPRLNSQRHASAPSKFVAVKFVTFRITWCHLLKASVSLTVTNIVHFTSCLGSPDVMPDWSQSCSFLLKYGCQNTCVSRSRCYLIKKYQIFFKLHLARLGFQLPTSGCNLVTRPSDHQG